MKNFITNKILNKKIISLILVVSILFPMLTNLSEINAEAYSKTQILTLANAQRLALNKSSKYIPTLKLINIIILIGLVMCIL